jgi:hypothetical protein
MLTRKQLSAGPLLVAILTFPAFAQDTATAAPPVNCEAQFTALDTDANGALSEAEAPQVFARARVDSQTIADGGYAKADYLAACEANAYVRAEPEEGAPLEGANSFTEVQAQDRALAWGVSDISALTKDDKGVWRGTGTLDGATVDVAVDYKGNVVTTAQ